MKVLWIVGDISLFPEAEYLLNGKKMEIKATGGWISSSAQLLAEDDEIDLFVAVESSHVNSFTKLNGNQIVYYVIPNDNKGYWRKLFGECCPQVIHIHGTENHVTILRFIEECGVDNTVVSMQGVRNAIRRYSNVGISFKDILLNITIHDVIKQDFLASSKKLNFRASKEREIISKIHHVIGRTICDRSYIWSINPRAKYYFCNETLRKEFYTGRWSYVNCTPYTIFLSQASRPLKGLHFLLQALPLIRQSYPDTKVRIAGGYFTKHNTFMERMKLSGYGKYINKEIRRLNLSNAIEFIGPLNAEEMKKEYLKANLFVNPSTIENSPNSLCEAQILGVPCLSSYVGGVPDMIPNKDCGEMYRFDEIEVLAYKVCQMFETSKAFDNTEMQRVALLRHNGITNLENLKEIYKKISKK